MQRKILITSVFLLTAVLVGGFALGGTPASVDFRFAAAPSRSGDVTFPLEGSQEVPPVETQFTGACDANLNAARTDFAITCNHNAPAIAAHIHRGEAGAIGPVVFFLDTATTFSFVVNEETLADQPGAATPISFDEFLDALDAGNLYVNVHTQANTGGELRGQIPPPPSNLYFATFGNGDGIVSDIVLLNAATTGGNVLGEVAFYDENGNLIPPMNIIGGGMTEPSGVPTAVGVDIPPTGEANISTSGMGETTVGAVHVTSEQPLDGVVRFAIDGLGVAGVGSSAASSGAIAPVRNAAGIQTGLAILNPGGDPITVMMSLRQDGAEVENGSAMAMLGPSASVSDLLEEFFPDANLVDFSGAVVLTTEDGVFAAVALEFGSGVFTTLPVSPLR